MKRLLILLTLLALLTLPSLAQTATPVPTPEITPSDEPVATPAPEAEGTAVPETPVVEVTIEAPEPAEPSVPVSAFEKIVDLLIAIVVAGGGVAAIKVFRDPERGKQFVAFGIDLLKMAAKFTPTTADDAALLRLEDAWKTALAGMVAEAAKEGAKAAVSDAMAAERAKLVVQTGNKVDALNIVPPPDVKA